MPSKNILIIIATIVALNNVAKYFSETRDDPIIGIILDYATAPMRFVTCGPSSVMHSTMDFFLPIETLFTRSSVLPWDIACFIVRGNPPNDLSIEANFTRLSIRWIWIAATCDLKVDGGKHCYEQFDLAFKQNKLF